MAVITSFYIPFHKEPGPVNSCLVPIPNEGSGMHPRSLKVIYGSSFKI